MSFDWGKLLKDIDSSKKYCSTLFAPKSYPSELYPTTGEKDFYFLFSYEFDTFELS